LVAYLAIEKKISSMHLGQLQAHRQGCSESKVQIQNCITSEIYLTPLHHSC